MTNEHSLSVSSAALERDTPTTPNPVKTVLAHDYLLVMRGAERSFLAMCELWPRAPIASLLFDPSVFGERLQNHPLRLSRLQRLGLTQAEFQWAMPFMPAAAERLNVSDADLVISSSSAFAHGIVPHSDAAHVCYCHTPFRYAWYQRERGLSLAPRPFKPLLNHALNRIQHWDKQVARRATYYIANSRISQTRMRGYWGVRAPIVHPPVQLARFSVGRPDDFFLVVCELVRHKQVDLVLEAAERAGVRVKVVGGGADETRLRARYGGVAEFLGRVDDETLAELYPATKALIIPNVEEFGITAVEAQACGRPVIAARAGGALETVIEDETGIFFAPGDVDELAAALQDPRLDEMRPDKAVANAARFSVAAFQRKILEHTNIALAAAKH